MAIGEDRRVWTGSDMSLWERFKKNIRDHWKNYLLGIVVIAATYGVIAIIQTFT